MSTGLINNNFWWVLLASKLLPQITTQCGLQNTKFTNKIVCWQKWNRITPIKTAQLSSCGGLPIATAKFRWNITPFYLIGRQPKTAVECSIVIQQWSIWTERHYLTCAYAPFKSKLWGLFSVQHLFLMPKLYSEYCPSDASCDYYN